MKTAFNWRYTVSTRHGQDRGWRCTRYWPFRYKWMTSWHPIMTCSCILYSVFQRNTAESGQLQYAIRFVEWWQGLLANRSRAVLVENKITIKNQSLECGNLEGTQTRWENVIGGGGGKSVHSNHRKCTDNYNRTVDNIMQISAITAIKCFCWCLKWKCIW